MATIYDGARVFAAAAGATALSTDQNTLQDKLILGLQSRVIGIPVTAAQGSTKWVYTFSNPHYWTNTDANPSTADIVDIELPYTAVDTQINAVSVVINGTAAGAEAGDIYLSDKTRTAAVPGFGVAWAITVDATDPWTLAGTITKVTVSGLTQNLDANVGANLRFRACNAAANRNLFIYSAEYTAMFHKGT